MEISNLAQLQWLFWPLLSLFALLGLIALVSPKQFEKVAQRSSRWVDTNKLVATMDRTVDVDRHVLRHGRLFGLAVLLAAITLAYYYAALIL